MQISLFPGYLLNSLKSTKDEELNVVYVYLLGNNKNVGFIIFNIFYYYLGTSII